MTVRVKDAAGNVGTASLGADAPESSPADDLMAGGCAVQGISMEGTGAGTMFPLFGLLLLGLRRRRRA